MIPKKRVDRLLHTMINDYASVNNLINPIYRDLENLSDEEMVNFLFQYSLFPKHIITFLVHGTYTLGYYSWIDVAAELRHNINEELGSGYGKISKAKLPHYAIFRKAIYEELQIDLNEAQPEECTASFIKNMTTVMDKSNPAFVTGASYALEATAIPELTMVYEITHELFLRLKKRMPKLLIDFFQFHIDEIEIEHRDRLIEEANKYLKTEQEIKDFEVGFRDVMQIMDVWWKGMYSEIVADKKELA